MIRNARPTEAAISRAHTALQSARQTGDQLKIDLAEAALNDLLDRAGGRTDVTHVTGNDRQGATQ